MREQGTMNEPAVRSYFALRKAIGIVGFALPFMLVIGTMLFQLLQGESLSIRPSISSYYYTVMGGVLVGSLCAIGAFLWSYKGYDNPAWLLRSVRVTDNRASNLAGACAIGVALCPTPNGSDPTTLEEFFGADWVGLFHVSFAGLFFASLAYISLYLFTKGDPVANKQDNRIYKACGWVIIGCMVAIFGVWFLPSDSFWKQIYPVFWLETIAVFAFSISWIRKGLDRRPHER
jgi:hypothetical protein